MKRILLIHSDTVVREALSRALTHDGHQVESVRALSSDEGRREGSEPQVVITEETAAEALSRIRQTAPGASVVALSSDETADATGADVRLSRPIDMGRLREALLGCGHPEGIERDGPDDNR